MSNSFSSDDNGAPQGNQGASFSTDAPVDDKPTTEATGNEDTSQDHSASIQKILKRLDDKDAFIEQLKSETAELRAQLNKRPNVDIDEVVEKVNQSRSTNDNVVDADELVNKVYQQYTEKMTAKQKEEVETSNFTQVQQTLHKHFGKEDVDAKVQELASQSGLDIDQVIALAKRSPKAVYKLLGVSESVAPPVTPFQGSTNTNGYNVTPPVKTPHIMSVRTDRERVALFKQKMDAGLANINRN